LQISKFPLVLRQKPTDRATGLV